MKATHRKVKKDNSEIKHHIRPLHVVSRKLLSGRKTPPNDEEHFVER